MRRTYPQKCPRCKAIWNAYKPNPVMCPRCHRILKGENKPQKAARDAVEYAVSVAKLTKPNTCQLCSRTARLHAHHTDYTCKLDVQWLCSSCHRSLHASLTPKVTIPIEQYEAYLQQELTQDDSV